MSKIYTFYDPNHVKTYEEDIELFKKLNLTQFSTTTFNKFFVGRVDFLENSYVDIWVEGFPSLFWTFEVYCEENKQKTYISTGMGGLKDFWNTIELILSNMIVIDKIEKEKING